MTEPFIGQVGMAAFDYPPRGWAACDGATLPIAQNQALFSLIGATFGGNGSTTFALPNLKGRVPIHSGARHPQGSTGGSAAHTLSQAEMPTHTHTVNASSAAGNSSSPTDNLLAQTPRQIYEAAKDLTPMDSGAIAPAGGGQGHENMQPYLAINYIIALQGVFPSRN